jgi:putative phosphoesterase
MKIGLLSDTHGWLDERVFHHFKECDEVWHAGDIGSLEIATRLAAFKPLRAVHGNIDGQNIRREYPQDHRFECGGMQVWMTHIGGKPPYYTPAVRSSLQQQVPAIFVCGHSHILRVMHDTAHPPLLYLNPGAAGREGHHQVRTLLRFTLQDKKVSEMQVIELGHRGEAARNSPI